VWNFWLNIIVYNREFWISKYERKIIVLIIIMDKKLIFNCLRENILLKKNELLIFFILNLSWCLKFLNIFLRFRRILENLNFKLFSKLDL
jgi:hypothetical protein